MKIAIVTGASSGMGREFVYALDREGKYEEIWVIARRADRLESLKTECKTAIRPIALDLGKAESFDAYRALLETEKPDVSVLVNCAGFGKFGTYAEIPTEVACEMIDLNCKALVRMTEYTLPYMNTGAHIVELDSLSSFQPVPYIGVYAASKAFVLSYSRALNRELDDKDISVMAVCPFWTKTEFFDHAVIDGEKPVVKKYAAMYEPQQIVARAWRDAKRGKDVSKFGFIARAQMALVKILPHGLIMDIWLSQQKL